jgi:hypothetical protein
VAADEDVARINEAVADGTVTRTLLQAEPKRVVSNKDTAM